MTDEYSFGPNLSCLELPPRSFADARPELHQFIFLVRIMTKHGTLFLQQTPSSLWMLPQLHVDLKWDLSRSVADTIWLNVLAATGLRLASIDKLSDLRITKCEACEACEGSIGIYQFDASIREEYHRNPAGLSWKPAIPSDKIWLKLSENYHGHRWVNDHPVTDLKNINATCSGFEKEAFTLA
ncbi:hypothetical protein N7466_007304 [Penicillium verhagenii]|uniref:uncharacterized protein n=1 Tax=Penicillium verhagenii TaxID=1562060 RepID=UPI002545A1E0|nr:uncharacterized protein N7466_007304 [Penicillium verhagenii]KAJ5928348.1 hypothetical protein N7466_007304 [Penicillium verhagenii]